MIKKISWKKVIFSKINFNYIELDKEDQVF